MKYRWLYVTISLVVIVMGLAAIGIWGYTYSIDFVGGTNLEYRFERAVSDKELKAVFTKDKAEVIDIRRDGESYIIRTKPLEAGRDTVIRKDLETALHTKVTALRAETVGPVLGRETMYKTMIAAGLAILGILIYMSFAFKGFTFALAAVIAMLHDFLVVIGMYALFSRFFGAEVDTMFVTAILTAMSFSVHDTIVIFDKIREYYRRHGKGDMEEYANRALTETLVRSFNNSMTIIFMLLALTLMGGATIRFFVATLLVGTITGTYSSPFVATPILVWLEKRKKK